MAQGRNTERADGIEETVIDIRRCAAVVKGGRRFSFSALVVVGNGAGQVGLGYGKAKEVPPAVEKAVKDGQTKLRRIALKEGSIPHEVTGRYGSAKVFLKPAGPGTGVIAGASVRAVVNAVGIKDILTKSFGSNNAINVAKATMNALERLRTRDQIAALRGVRL